VKWAVFTMLVFTSGGCASFPGSLPEVQPSAFLPGSDVAGIESIKSAPPPDAEQDNPAAPAITVAEEPILAAAAKTADEPAVPGGQVKDPVEEPTKKGDQVPDEGYDPFAQKGESLSEQEEYDPWEPFNTVMFEFNRKLDKYILKPVAQVYEKVMPDALELGIRNFFRNVRFGPRLINNIFQVKFKGAGIEAGRFLVNSTLGLGGLFDPAKNLLGMETPDEDTGQTLGVYGVKPGPYLVLPILPPLTLRDFFGFLFDIGLDPINYFLFPSFEVDDWPSLIAHKNRDTTAFGQLGSRVEEIVNDRSLNLDKFQGVEEATVDLYSAVRNAYLQKRGKAIRE
jgi:phospholipid-binding lipoprotein MlaA